MYARFQTLVKKSFVTAVAYCTLSGSIALAQGNRPRPPVTPPAPAPKAPAPKAPVTVTPLTPQWTRPLGGTVISGPGIVTTPPKAPIGPGVGPVSPPPGVRLPKIDPTINIGGGPGLAPPTPPTPPTTPPPTTPPPTTPPPPTPPPPTPPPTTPPPGTQPPTTPPVTQPPLDRRVVTLLIIRELLQARAQRPIVIGGGSPVVIQQPVQSDPVISAPVQAPVPPNTVQATPEAESDVELLGIRFVDGGDDKQGPRFRVTIRNNGSTNLTKGFNVLVAGSLSRQLAKDSPQTFVRVEGIRAGETVNVDVRLPVSALRMGRNIEGNSVPFAWLIAAVDTHGEVPDPKTDNNVSVMNRLDIAMVEGR